MSHFRFSPIGFHQDPTTRDRYVTARDLSIIQTGVRVSLNSSRTDTCYRFEVSLTGAYAEEPRINWEILPGQAPLRTPPSIHLGDM